jgi:hypothetical protein
MSVFAKCIVGAWALFWSFVLFLVLAPRLATQIPHLQFIRPYIMVLFIVTVVYGTAWLYHHGMKRAKRNKPDGGSHH